MNFSTLLKAQELAKSAEEAKKARIGTGRRIEGWGRKRRGKESVGVGGAGTNNVG